MLQFVRDELLVRRGKLRRIAKETGVSYDTLLRIRDNEVDPGYSKVKAVFEYMQRAA